MSRFTLDFLPNGHHSKDLIATYFTKRGPEIVTQEAKAAIPNARILLVDIETNTCDLLQHLLSQLYEVEVVAEGGAALIGVHKLKHIPIHPENRQRIRDQVATMLATSGRYAVEYQVLNKDHQYIDVLDQGIAGQRDTNGNSLRQVGSTWCRGDSGRAGNSRATGTRQKVEL